MRDIDGVIADALGIAATEVNAETAFRAIPEWDSLGHVELMLALEEHLGVEIGADLMTHLTSVRAIRDFARDPRGWTPGAGDDSTDDVIHRGLSGVNFDETLVSSIDGVRGRLTYRGYSIDDLVRSSTFEEVAYLLLHGRLPTERQLDGFVGEINAGFHVPEQVAGVLRATLESKPIDSLRTALSAGGPQPLAPAGLLGQTAAVVIEQHALRMGRRAATAEPVSSFAGRLMTVLRDGRASVAEERVLDQCLILLAEHGANASAFAGRVAIGTRADLRAALTAAIATFAGPLHGGAIEAVGAMIEQIGDPTMADDWVRAQRASKAPVMGFGHRVYRTEDPRALHLRQMADELTRSAGDRRGFEIVEAVRESMRAHARHGVDINVDLYAGIVFSALRLPRETHLPIFVVARTAGWLAHALEQRQRNVLIRPSLRYAGEVDRGYIPLPERGAHVTAASSPSAATAEHDLSVRLESGFLASLGRAPHALALRTHEQSWTYQQLAETAGRWAAAIGRSLDGPPGRVAVLGLRSEVSYGGALAALLAGATYVPLSPEMPIARTRLMLESSQPDALIVDRHGVPMLGELLAGLGGRPVVLAPGVDSDAEAESLAPDLLVLGGPALAGTPDLEMPAPSPADQPAYLLFTSGSTGMPKGVPISHANAVSFLRAAQHRYGVVQEDRLSQTFPQTFDLSIFDTFMAWGGGACVCVPQPTDVLAPFRYVRDQGITVWFSVPSLANLLMRKGLLQPASLPSLRLSLFCGEALPQATAEAWQAAAPASTLENLYGPTECTIACTVYRWVPDLSPLECVNGLVPIGRPLDGVRTLVVDEHQQPVATGEAGELLVGGAQTFAGYWNDRSATARSFVEIAEGARSTPYYRTGDQVMANAQGALCFLGRLDQQIKVTGFRVELAEIEAVMRSWPGVNDVVVVPFRPAAGSAEGLTAFVSGVAIDVRALAALAQARLPSYMVPRGFHLVEEFPLNSNGKVDRSALMSRTEG